MTGRSGGAALAVVALLAAAPAPAKMTAEQRIEQLERALKAAQEEIEELKQEVRGNAQAQHATQQQAEEATQQAAQAAKTASTVDRRVPGWLERVTLFGDVRFRHEGFYHQPSLSGEDVTARNRERIRARVGLKYAFSDELAATVRLASGDVDDPISTNQTLGGTFDRKSIGLDWAYLTFAPGRTFGIRPGLVGTVAGKFPNPMFRTDEMVFDDDLSPEGFSQTVQLLGSPVGPLDQVRLHVLEWTFAEVSNQQDGWMFGGQINPTMHAGPVLFEAGVGQLWWLDPDLIAQALSRNTTAFTASGAPVTNPNYNSALVNTNLLVTRTVQPPPVNGKTPAAFRAITGYRSAFDQTNLDFAATLPDVWRGAPLRGWVDYVYNWDAATDDAHGVQAGLRLGQTRVRGDWSLYGFYEYLGQEAAISAFTHSNYGTGGTNLQGPSVGVDYQLLDPLTVSARSYFTNYINTPAGSTNPTLTRLQLDALVKF
jgi:hypothetical protein